MSIAPILADRNNRQLTPARGNRTVTRLSVRRFARVLLATGPGLATSASKSSSQAIPADWRLVREATVGRDADEQHSFTKILAMLPTERGSLIVADMRQTSIRVFDEDGAFLRSVGRRGAGPGEFQRLQQVGMLGDTIWVSDGELRRTTLFRFDGSVVSSQAWEFKDPVVAAAGRGGNFIHGVFADGSACGENDGHLATVMRGGTEVSKAVVRMSRTGRTRDTMAIIPTPHSMFSVLFDGGMHFGQQKFPDAPLVVGAPSVSRLYLVHRAAATSASRDNIRIVAIQANDDTLWSRNLAYTPRKLEKAQADSFIGAMQRSIQRSGASAEAIRRQLFVPEFRPPVSGAFAAEDGTLWLRREEGRTTVEYWAIAPDGSPTGRVTVPMAVTLRAARGTQVWAEEKDVDDVPVVVRFRMMK